MNRTKYLFTAAFILACAVFVGTNTRSAKAASSHSQKLITFWSFTDDFSGGSPLWDCWEDPQSSSNSCLWVSGGPGFNVHARLTAGVGISTVAREVTLTPFPASAPMSCYASMKVRPRTGGLFPMVGQLEVIDVDTWTYLAIKAFSFSAGSPFFSTQGTGAWAVPHRNVVVRMVLQGNNPPNGTSKAMDIDDMSVACLW